MESNPESPVDGAKIHKGDENLVPNGGRRPHYRPLQDIEDVKRELSRTYYRLKTKSPKTHDWLMDAQRARTAAYVLSTLLRAFEAERDEKLASLEEQLTAIKNEMRTKLGIVT